VLEGKTDHDFMVIEVTSLTEALKLQATFLQMACGYPQLSMG
jgi:hypothetical protein